jgi:hypothetical protein
MMNRERLNDRESVEKPTRIDKTLQWLAISRDSWKEKTKESKTKLKIATLALKRAREHRDQFEAELEEKCRSNQKQLDQKDDEIAMLKNKLEQAIEEIDILKKKK